MAFLQNRNSSRYLLLALILFLSLPLSNSSSIHDLLKSMGLPAGLLPKDVKSYTFSGSGLLEVFLDGPCLTKFDTMALYESEVRANLTYGSLTGVEGLSQEELFLWLPVKDIVVDDPSSGLILIDIGVAHKQLSLSLFEDPPDCSTKTDYDQGFFSLQQLLHEEGLGSPPHQQASASWAEMLVTREGGNLTDTQRRFIVDKLLVMRENEKLPRGSQSKIAVEVGVHRSTISRIFKKAEEQRLRGENIDVRSLIPKNCGAKPLECTEEWLQSAPLHLRCNYRAYAGALKCSHMRIQRLLKKGLIRAHTSNNHPSVTDPHKIARMKWCLSHIIPGTQNLNATFVDMRNVIHIDEKWFYLNPDMRRFYLLPKEIDPYRTCQSRRYKIKAMFMGVNGRPLYGENGQMIHDGKYGMFPFIFKQRAKKSSKNRVAGTMETKAIQNVTKQVIRDMIINKVIPSIMDKWPANMPKNIIVQQDNARPHLQPNDTDFKACATQNGYNIQLIFQPPQSPDLNVLDLGLFRSVQSLQYQSFPKNLDDLIEKVEAAYNRFDPNLINYTWLQLQYVMVEILKVRGGNNYKNPHHGKARMERLGILPQNVEFPQRVVDEAVHYLNELCNDNVDDMQFFEDGMEVDADYM